MRKWTVLAALVLLAACRQQTAIWVVRGSTRYHLVLELGREDHNLEPVSIGYLVVRTCSANESGEMMWAIGGKTGTASIDRVTYGTLPNGFETSSDPKPLVPGCYETAISGTGKTRFAVQLDGVVVEQ